MKAAEFKILDLGLIEYKDAWWFQKEVYKAVREELETSMLILARHYPVITMGRAANRENILAQTEDLKNKGIEIFNVERGGDVAYHGPGQLIAYPIFDLNQFKKDIHWYLRSLEQVIIALLADWGIEARRKPGLTGAWVGDEKIASIGIAIKRWITFHGLSLNVKNVDLENFGLIKPCGMDARMTSLETITSKEIDIESLKVSMLNKFKEVFTIHQPQSASEAELLTRS